MQAGGRSLRLLSGVLGFDSANSPKAELQAVSTGRKTGGKRTLEAVQDAGGGRVLWGVAGRGSSYIWTGEKILYTWARLLICCPFPLPFSPLLLVVLVVSCGLDAVADSRRDGMRAGGCCLLVADGRRGGVLVGKRGGQWPGVSPSAFALCPCPSACWAWCWRWRAGCLASSAGQGWRAVMGGGRGWGVLVLGGLSRPPGGGGAIRHIAQSFA